MSGRVWDPIARALAPGRALALDARGHGDSDRDAEAQDWYATGVADLEAVVDAAQLERFSLVGHSMGANVALRFTARRPDAVERLALLDAGPDLPGAGSSTRRARPVPKRRPPLSGFESVDAYADALGMLYPRARPETLKRLAGHWLRQRSDGRFEPKHDPAFLRPREGGLGPGSSWARAETARLWDQLAGLRCPLLVVRGSESTVLGSDAARRMAEVAPDARLVELAGSGHGVMLDAEGALRDALLAFLS